MIGYDSLSTYPLNEEEAETLVAFIKNHEKEDIPEDVWEICVNLQDFIEDWKW